MIPEYEEELAETGLVLQALRIFFLTTSMWESNFVIFRRMSDRARILWWRGAKKQAQLGVPAMQALLLKVIELRLTR